MPAEFCTRVIRSASSDHAGRLSRTGSACDRRRSEPGRHAFDRRRSARCGRSVRVDSPLPVHRGRVSFGAFDPRHVRDDHAPPDRTAWLRFGLPDGVLLALHGSMYADGACPTPRARFIDRVRAVVGPTIPIAITLDLPCQRDGSYVRWRRYPDQLPDDAACRHVRKRASGVPTARRGDARHHRRPKLYVARLPMLAGMDMGRTLDPEGPMCRPAGRRACDRAARSRTISVSK